MSLYRNTYVTVTCINNRCGKQFSARKADRNRGWGLYCSKSCKAICQSQGNGPAPRKQPKVTDDPIDQQSRKVYDEYDAICAQEDAE
jgi:hypothetical protein